MAVTKKDYDALCQKVAEERLEFLDRLMAAYDGIIQRLVEERFRVQSTRQSIYDTSHKEAGHVDE